jgi:endonuclease/exonuclease/phosphatase family metal-dependent hydrolase
VRRTIAALVLVTAMAWACSSGGSDAKRSSDDASTTSSKAAQTGKPAQKPKPVRVVTLNLLHGLFCPPETDACRAPDRVAIFAELVEQAGCPDLIGLQEIGMRLEQLLPATVEKLCDGRYTIAWQAVASPDREMVLSRLPIVERGYLDIANFPWEAYWVRVDAPAGPVDFLTTHFASSSNNPDCQPGRCPPVCANGISTNECNAVEVVDFFRQRTSKAALTIVAGDLNARPGSPTLTALTGAGFRDAWLEARRPECDPTTHNGCTGGGSAPEPFVGMDTKEGAGYDARIDYVLVRPGEDCDVDLEVAGFADKARPSPLNGMFWPADHAGVQATIGCA